MKTCPVERYYAVLTRFGLRRVQGFGTEDTLLYETRDGDLIAIDRPENITEPARIKSLKRTAEKLGQELQNDH
jgi:hypothetical protein